MGKDEKSILGAKSVERISQSVKFWGIEMTYYKSWQEALMVFILMYGHNYKDSYNLMAEFENKLQQNAKGAYFISN